MSFNYSSHTHFGATGSPCATMHAVHFLSSYVLESLKDNHLLQIDTSAEVLLHVTLPKAEM